ncbi:Phosphatidylinositol mannoside acyltransferase [Austwickia sp. TVS 96-490-7B]|uniref:phosphatidylinositol mannoside acyltransferase n=1 Tax=Austwickia sp. TVS 96-490-7B TaxID=2830843 RepID=UPI001C57BE89|nr:phosphatidylinositol mannoside acyltransferase [Austwickia sp. TVS 96-490-7B]MBW3086313.1 Phosphatidylinositol mannoside acyltransferase [Austwickia sp. TVS 96-490-7B]
MRWAERASLWAFRGGWSAVRRLPSRTAYRLFDTIADAAYARDVQDVRRLRANYAMVHPLMSSPELESVVRAGMRSYLRYWCEAFRLPEFTVEQVRASVRAVGTSTAEAELQQGRSVVAFLAHMGNWDLAGAWSGSSFAPVTTVAERLRPEELFEEFLSFRTRLGMHIVPLTGGPAPFPLLVEAARAGGRLIPLLADRDLSERGVPVTFCDRPARMAAGPAAVAVASGARLYPVSVHYEPVPVAVVPSGWRAVVTFHDEVTDPGAGSTRDRVAVMTQECASVFSAVVREHTADWHMMQQVFTGEAVLGGRDGIPRGATGPGDQTGPVPDEVM